MATKMSSPANKTASTKKPEAHPRAVCPLPPHLQVDLESAETEWMKSRQPADAPGLVFSTRALEHGKNAAGAAGLRKGFAWNDQMDLAWALGYPAMTFLVDGVEDSREGILAFFGKTLDDAKKEAWFSTIAGSRNILPRRAAFALLHELEHRENPFHLSEEEFLELTEPRDLSPTDTAALLGKAQSHNIEEIAFLIESLVGSLQVATAVCEHVEAPIDEDDDDALEARTSWFYCLKPMCRRVLTNDARVLFSRTVEVDPWFGDPLASGRKRIAKGQLDSALADLQWVDGMEREALVAFKASTATRVGDIPFPRHLYAGGEPLIEEQVKLFDKYMDGPVKFFREYSTIRHPRLAGPALLARAHKAYREGMTLWFEMHADYFRPLLAELAKDSAYGKHAAALAQYLG